LAQIEKLDKGMDGKFEYHFEEDGEQWVPKIKGVTIAFRGSVSESGGMMTGEFGWCT
jgi:hypothetical protein